MNRYSIRPLFKAFIIAIMFVLFAAFEDVKIGAMSFVYESDSEVFTHDKTDVIKFDYSYIVKFDEEDDLGVNVKDGEKSLMNEPIYAGESLTIKFDDVKNGVFTPKKDSMEIYEYSSARNSFDSRIAIYVDEDATYTFINDGLYKIVYTYKDSVKYTTYVYVHRDYYTVKMNVNKKHDNVSVFKEMSFRLIVKDSSDLSKSKYYYGFGVRSDEIEYTEFTNQVEVDSGAHALDGEFTVAILDKYCSKQKQNLYIKIVKNVKGTEHSKVLQSEKQYRVTNKIEGVAHLVDENENILSDTQYYKSGDNIHFVVFFNQLVKYSSLQYTVNGSSYYNLADVQNEATNSLKISYHIIGNDNFIGNFGLRTNNSDNIIVSVDGTNIVLDLDTSEMAKFHLDCTKPFVTVSSSQVEGAYYNNHKVDVLVSEKDSDLKYVIYYVDICHIMQEGVCKDSEFNDEHPLIKEASYVKKNEEQELVKYLYNVFIDTSFGYYDHQELTLYIKTEDSAGNVTYLIKNGYFVDNVIVPKTVNAQEMFVTEDIQEDSKVVGKKLVVKVPNVYEVETVRYKKGDITGMCSLRSNETEFDIFDCIIVKYDYEFEGEIVLLDIYNNEESYPVKFRYSSIVDGVKNIGGNSFTLSRDGDFELETNIYNIMSAQESTQKLKFDDAVLQSIEDILNLSDMPIDLNTLVKDLVIVEGEEKIFVMLVDNEVIFPTSLELLEYVKHINKFKTCSLKGNNCDLNLFIRYRYNIYGINQERLVHIKFLDNSLKYEIKNENFSVENKVKVNSSYEELNYELFNAYNVSVSKEDANINKVITYVDISGTSSVVSAVDTSKLGVYYISESYSYNNLSSFPLEYVVEVVDDESPTIRLNVDKEIVLNVGEKFNEEGIVSANDNYDENVIIKSEWNKALDINKVGTYIVSYWAEDGSGNKSSIVTVTVVVKEKVELKTYLICGGIVLFTMAVILIAAFIDRGKEKRKS